MHRRRAQGIAMLRVAAATVLRAVEWRQQVLCAAAVAWLMLPGSARAQSSYPSRSITFIVPTSPGTVLDILARLYADRLAKLLNGSVAVMNRPGAAGLIAAQTVASVPADGYTFLVGNSGQMNLAVIHKNLPFDPVNDFVGVSMLGEAPVVVTVPALLGVKSLKEFVALAKSKPGSINYASLGTGSSTHIAGAYFAKQADVRLSHVPYKDVNITASDLASNLVQVLFSPIAPQTGQIKAGTLLGLAVSANEPMQTPLFVPTAASQGVDYIYSTWYGLLALKGTPPDIVERLSRGIAETSKDPEIIATIEAQGIVPHSLAAAEFQQRIRDEIQRLAPVLKEIEAQPKADR
jgi:tripartite-type tricarboxylate transporter receptor subunit TctC